VTVQFGQPLDYPSVNVALDRETRGACSVITTNDSDPVPSRLPPSSQAGSRSRSIGPLPTTGIAYQVQVQVPQTGNGHRLRT